MATSLVALARVDLITRLRAAATAAIAGEPLHQVKVPLKRREIPKIDPATPIVLVKRPRVRRGALKDTIPAFQVTITFSIDVLVASGRDDSEILDDRLDDLLDAIDGVLFEDPAWVAQWEEIVTADEEFPEVDHDDYDVALAQLSIDVTTRWDFPPKVTAPFEGLGVTAAGAGQGTSAGVVVGPVAGHPDETHRIYIDTDLPQEDP